MEYLKNRHMVYERSFFVSLSSSELKKPQCIRMNGSKAISKKTVLEEGLKIFWAYFN
jgi:hypothetical protein